MVPKDELYQNKFKVVFDYRDDDEDDDLSVPPTPTSPGLVR